MDKLLTEFEEKTRKGELTREDIEGAKRRLDEVAEEFPKAVLSWWRRVLKEL